MMALDPVYPLIIITYTAFAVLLLTIGVVGYNPFLGVIRRKWRRLKEAK